MATQAKEVFLTPPLTIAGCRLWFDAADSSTITGTTSVTAWRDKTASLTLTGSGSTYSNVNGYPTVTFNGNQFISSRNLPYESVCTSDANFTTFMVQLTTSSSGVNGIPFTIFLTDNVRRLAVFSSGGGSGGIFVDGASQASPRLSGITQTLNTPQLFCITRKNITTMTARLNGSQVSSADFPGTTNFISSSSYFVYISAGGGPWTGNMYEIIHYNRDISDLEIQQVEGYLSWKWGLQRSLPRSHPFFSASPYQTLSVPISRSVPLRMSSSTYFSPTAISGCALWLDAADTSTFTFSSGSNISQWNDKSSQLNNATQSTSSNQAVLTNSRVSFTPTQFMVLDSTKLPNGSASVSYFMVVESTGSSPASVFFSHGDGNNGFTLQLYFNGGDILRQDLNGASIVSDTLNTRNQTIIVSNILTSTNEELWRNGNSVASLAITKSIGTGIARIGINVNGFWPFTGTITEIIVYSSALSTTQRQQTEGYLAWKWGLQASLPPTHPNYTVPYVPFPFPTSIPKAAIRDWSPLRVSGSQLWLDAADTTSFTLSGSNVTQWSDKSGVGNNATPYSTSPQRVGNSVLFSGSNAIKCGKFLTSISYSVFIVNNFASGFTNKISFGCWKVEYGSFTYVEDGSIRVGVNNSGNYNVDASTSTASFNTNRIYGLTLSSSSTPGSAFTFNGSIDGSNVSLSGTSTSGNATTCAEEVTIGGLMEDSIPKYQLNGYVYEVIVYNSALSTAQRQQVEGYLAWKWGLRSNLPAGHPYINFPPSP